MIRRARRPVLLDERGVGLMEIIVATVIATISVLGLAYTIGTGRTLLNRSELARAGLAGAQRRMEILSAARGTDPQLTIPDGRPSASYSEPFVVGGAPVGIVRWTVTWVTDPADTVLNGHSLRLVSVRTSWSTGTDSDAVTLQRRLPAY
jgi:hypothetical protein